MMIMSMLISLQDTVKAEVRTGKIGTERTPHKKLAQLDNHGEVGEKF